jgi:hypothetical protein
MRGQCPNLDIINRDSWFGDVKRGIAVNKVFKPQEETQLSSYSFAPINGGFVAKERLERFRAEAFTEIALRSVGIILTVGPVFFLVAILTMLGVLPEAPVLIASAMCSVVGLLIYAYGSRGFRRQMSLDTHRGQVSVTKINLNGNTRIDYRIDKKDIQSIYVQRPRIDGDSAKLCLRVKGRNWPVILISGGLHEVRLLHRVFCDTIAPKQKAQRQGRPRKDTHSRGAVA